MSACFETLVRGFQIHVKMNLTKKKISSLHSVDYGDKTPDDSDEQGIKAIFVMTSAPTLEVEKKITRKRSRTLNPKAFWH